MKEYTSDEMILFGNFIRDNYHGVGTPKLISYNHIKYPHGTIEEIFKIWKEQVKECLSCGNKFNPKNSFKHNCEKCSYGTNSKNL